MEVDHYVQGSIFVWLANGIEQVVTSHKIITDENGYMEDYDPVPVRPPGRAWEMVDDQGDIAIWERSVWKRLHFDDDNRLASGAVSASGGASQQSEGEGAMSWKGEMTLGLLSMEEA